MTGDSAKDACFGTEGSLCVIYLAKDESQKDEGVFEGLYNVGQSFASKISRGLNFRFMWLNA